MNNRKNRLFEIEICRTRKSLPYGCGIYIPEIELETDNLNEVIDSQYVNSLIDKTFGKRLTVTISRCFGSGFSQWEVNKNRALL